MTAGTDPDSTDSEQTTEDPLADVEVGETVEFREENRFPFWNGPPENCQGNDREAGDGRFENVRVEYDDDGLPQLVWEQAVDVTRTVSERDAQHERAKREYERQKKREQREKNDRRARLISTGIGIAVTLGFAALFSSAMPELRLQETTVDPGAMIFPIVFVVLLVGFIAAILPYLPGKVMSA